MPLLRVMSGSPVLLQLGSVLVSVASIATEGHLGAHMSVVYAAAEGHADVSILLCHLRPC